jgi:hypothetical protein
MFNAHQRWQRERPLDTYRAAGLWRAIHLPLAQHMPGHGRRGVHLQHALGHSKIPFYGRGMLALRQRTKRWLIEPSWHFMRQYRTFNAPLTVSKPGSLCRQNTIVGGGSFQSAATLTASKLAWPLAYFSFLRQRFLRCWPKQQRFKHCRRLRKIVLHLPLHRAPKKKACYLLNSRLSLYHLGWLMGLEPTTTGITILDSTN